VSARGSRTAIERGLKRTTIPELLESIRVIDVTWPARLEAGRRTSCFVLGLLDVALMLAILLDLVNSERGVLSAIVSLFAINALFFAGDRSVDRSIIGAAASATSFAFFYQRRAEFLACIWVLETATLFLSLLLALLASMQRETVAPARSAALALLTPEKVEARRRSQRFRGRASRNEGRKGWMKFFALGLFGIGVPFLGATRLPIHLALAARRRARELGTPEADEHKAFDRRPPALWLRGFATEDVALEHLVGHWLELLGPFISAKNPGSPGIDAHESAAAAARLGPEWPQWVEREMAAAGVIVLVVGTTSGVRAELESLISLQCASKSIFLFQPRVSTLLAEAHWRLALECLGLGDRSSGAGTIEASRVLAFVEAPDGPNVFVARTRNASAYRVAVMMALSKIAPRVQAHPTEGSRSPLRTALCAVVIGAAVIAGVVGAQLRTEHQTAGDVAELRRVSLSLAESQDPREVEQLCAELTALIPADAANTLALIAQHRAGKAKRADPLALELYRQSVEQQTNDAAIAMSAAKWTLKEQKVQEARSRVEHLRKLNDLLDRVENPGREPTPSTPFQLTEKERAVLSTLARSLSRGPNCDAAGCALLEKALGDPIGEGLCKLQCVLDRFDAAAPE